ncbi:MAG: hypothetical protein SPI28_02110, partial [Acetatifactor sp.]|nr:hypothetical protein [Acetatifactor sp.]
TTKELYHKYKTFPVRSGKASRTGGKAYPVSSGIRFPMERNMQANPLISHEVFTENGSREK